MRRKYSFNESEFKRMLAQFNAILGPTPFKATQSNKTQDDDYGVEIRVNDIYYRRDYGGYSNVVKLSRRSMEDVLFAVMWGNHSLQDLGEFFINQQQQKMREVVESFGKSPASPIQPDSLGEGPGS